MKVYSWNVNGIRSVVGKGFLDWLNQSGAHIVGLQEVRAKPEQIPEAISHAKVWHTHFVAAERPGYSGVGLLARVPPDSVETSIDESIFDVEGRVQIARYGKLVVVNVYFPNGKGKNDDNSRIPYKLAFYRRLFDVIEPLKSRGERILVMGDFNTAHQEIDLARPKENQNVSGFCANEREELDRWVAAGWVDTFRQFHPETVKYSWWSTRAGARARNVGWRIDYVMASKSAMLFVRDAFILPDVMGSDHCPVGVDLDPAIVV